jgi:lipopolysaccharide/colanic/teichoic acid biosynthesis glycosyltransferase
MIHAASLPRSGRHPSGAYPLLVPPQCWYVVGKVIFDFVIALTLAILALPIYLLIALAVKLTSRGPVLYSQVRLGQNGRPFEILKIRTMQHDCERVSGARWSLPGDPRVTPLGRFLRLTHLDELPQLWNILRGEMSLVGPRPERPEFVPALERAIPSYRARLLVRPGITGLAQVQLAADTDLAAVRRKVDYDLHYIRHFSCWLDVRILACTALHISGLSCHKLCGVLLGIGADGLSEKAAACDRTESDRIGGGKSRSGVRHLKS